MLLSAPIRSLLARWREWSPLAVLLVALASAFALGGDRPYPRDASHNELISEDLAIAGNMSPDHAFRLARRIWRNEDGGFEYDLFGRFPIGGYVLIKLAFLPFESDFSASLLAARVLIVVSFCGAALFAYSALARIAGSRWIALSAVLLAFSGFYALHFADSVAGQGAMDLFGVALALHGIAVFVQEGRFRQLLLKTCAALLLGWHVYALVLPFALMGFCGEAFALVRSAFAGGGARALAAALPALARSRFIALAAVSILFGSALLALNFANEYAAYGGSRSLRDLPSVDSLMRRTGSSESYSADEPDRLFLPNFWARQFMRAGAASVPYALAPLFGDWDIKTARDLDIILEAPGVLALAAATGALALAAALAGAAMARRHRLSLAALALLGFCWIIPVRYIDHAIEAVFFIGTPMTMIATALMGARALLGERPIARFAIVALGAASAVVFALSSFYESRPYEDVNRAAEEFDVATLSELRAMRDMTMGKSVLVSSEVSTYVPNYRNHLVAYALAGSYVVYEGEAAAAAPYDFTISRYRDGALGALTLGNRFVFLHPPTDPSILRRAERRRLEASEPAARAAFDVYQAGDRLRYLKSPCAPEDADAFFFAHFFPADADYLRGGGEYAGFEGVNFPFAASGNVFDGACMATAHLPDYPVAAIRTGQYVHDSPWSRASEEGAWAVSIFPPPSAETLAAYESAYRAVADGEPAARSGFDLHLNGLNGNRTISYLKQPCSEEDARGRFWLSVHPLNVADLPPERRELGHESLNFDFVPPHGVVFNGKCMATIQLPDYSIDRIETGQWVPGGERLWDAAVEVGD